MQPLAKEIETLSTTQHTFTHNLRNPDNMCTVTNVTPDRMKLYQELVYNNIESIVRQAFPVITSILSSQQWHTLIQKFIQQNEGDSPYFFQLSEQFVEFLGSLETETLYYPFLLELAHYEWIELDVELEKDEEKSHGNISEIKIYATPLKIQPTVRVLGYFYPVHKISKDYLPSKPTKQPIFLVVYRNVYFNVKFMEVNVLTAQLIEVISTTNATIDQALSLVANNLQLEQTSEFLTSGKQLCLSLITKNILAYA